jgi:hypothetical protein
MQKTAQSDGNVWNAHSVQLVVCLCFSTTAISVMALEAIRTTGDFTIEHLKSETSSIYLSSIKRHIIGPQR